MLNNLVSNVKSLKMECYDTHLEGQEFLFLCTWCNKGDGKWGWGFSGLWAGVGRRSICNGWNGQVPLARLRNVVPV